MIQELAALSEAAMQELLLIEMMQQIWERSGLETAPQHPSSPYFWEGHQAPLRHVRLGARMSLLKTNIQLHPKSDAELAVCIQKIKEQAEKVASGLVAGASEDIVKAAKMAIGDCEKLGSVIAFGKLYYTSYLDGLSDNS